MRIFVFGMGKIYRRYKGLLQNWRINGFLDNDPHKQGTIIDGYRVIAPEDIQNEEYEAVLLMGNAWCEMKKDLLALDVPEEKIYPYHLMRDIMGNSPLFPKSLTILPKYGWYVKKRKAALFSNDLLRSGAPVALLPAAEYLVKEGWQVTVYASGDGPLRDAYLTAGVKLVLQPGLEQMYLDDLPELKDMDLLLINTAYFYNLLRGNFRQLPTIWWLHESESFYRLIPTQCWQGIAKKGVHLFTVGRKADEPFLARCGALGNPGHLLYGRPDFYEPRSAKQYGDKLIFACIGGIGRIKGQDILVRAIASLPDELRARAEFRFIGSPVDELQYMLKEAAKHYPQIKLCGEYTQTEVRKAYQEIDVLVCPSRSDSMSIVGTEALMCHIPCLVTDRVGLSDFLEDGRSGWICPAEDVERLAGIMTDIIQEPANIYKMGDAARKVYEHNFSIDIFEQNFKRAIECSERHRYDG